MDKNAELNLIYNDIIELSSIILSLEGDPRAGYLGLALSSVVSFVVRESDRYFCQRRINNNRLELSDGYKAAIAKLRALLKIFESNDGGITELVSSLTFFQRKTSEWLNFNNAGIKGYLKKNIISGYWGFLH